MNNIEIKDHIQGLGASFQWLKHQRDVFFVAPRGYLKLRTHDGSSSGELIAYEREPGCEPRSSQYDIAQISGAPPLERALTRSLGVRGVVKKMQALYLWESPQNTGLPAPGPPIS